MNGFAIGTRMANQQSRRSRNAGAASTREAGSVPARIMVPRTIFVICSAGLVLFGLLMIYSASSITGLTSEQYGYDATYFLVRQLLYVGIGLVFGGILAWVDYRMWKDRALMIMWGLTFCSLVMVYSPMAGQDAYGATRWISIAGFTLQPSEFAKVTIILTGAYIAEQYWELGTLEDMEALKWLIVGVAVPLGFILMQPDKGTTGVLVLTLLVMSYLAGVPGKAIGIFFLACVGVAAVIALRDDYSRARIMTVFDPFRDEFDAGYQLVQGFYALGSGGLTGVGLGLSRQKYNYLPMAHNDFIFAVVGEELGFVGTVGLLAAFALLLWAGLKIAENAPDLRGRLIAAGCTSLIIIQLLLNVSGVIGVFPLSGKPVPFISYGGSSIISTLMIVGLVLSVSLRSELPQTPYDRRRAELRIAGERAPLSPNGPFEGSTVTDPSSRLRSVNLNAGMTTLHMGGRRAASQNNTSLHGPTSELLSGTTRLRLVDGNASKSAGRQRRERVDTTRIRRLDLGPNSVERLRGRRNER
ncbi:MAG: putative peptidoglycan glycosyltransferase FtsW [Atopobiaceae bacterium]|nr:putative peptidoglycan glycosyltransferase FtsW [Atopobiaceae bacterium]